MLQTDWNTLLLVKVTFDFRQWLGAKQVINHYLNQSPTSVAHICVPWHWIKEDIIASRNGKSSIRRQAITLTIYGSSSILTTGRYLNTLRPRRNGLHFADDIFAQRDNNVENTWNHQRTIIYIQNHLFCIIGSVIDLDTIACPSVSSLRAIVMEFGMDIIVTYGTFSIIFILVTTDVVGDNWCGRFGLWPFRSVAVPVCGRFGLWPFRFVAVPVCGRFGLWPFRFVAVSVCGRFGCGRFGLWPLWPVTSWGPLVTPGVWKTCLLIISSISNVSHIKTYLFWCLTWWWTH